MRPNIEQIDMILERIDAHLGEMEAQLSVLESGKVRLQSDDGSGSVPITHEWSQIARRNIDQIKDIRAGVEFLRGGRFTAQLAEAYSRSA